MNCHECKFKREIPDNSHISCGYYADNPLVKAVAIATITSLLNDFARRVRAISPKTEWLNENGKGIKFNIHGVLNGWCTFPIDYDPIWIKDCHTFKKVGEE